MEPNNTTETNQKETKTKKLFLLLLISIVLVLGAIGLGYTYFSSQNNSNDENLQETEQNEQEENSTEMEDNNEESNTDTVETRVFQSELYDLKFEYPVEWGDPIVEHQDNIYATNITGESVTFPNIDMTITYPYYEGAYCANITEEVYSVTGESILICEDRPGVNSDTYSATAVGGFRPSQNDADYDILEILMINEQLDSQEEVEKFQQYYKTLVKTLEIYGKKRSDIINELKGDFNWKESIEPTTETIDLNLILNSDSEGNYETSTNAQNHVKNYLNSHSFVLIDNSSTGASQLFELYESESYWVVLGIHASVGSPFFNVKIYDKSTSNLPDISFEELDLSDPDIQAAMQSDVYLLIKDACDWKSIVPKKVNWSNPEEQNAIGFRISTTPGSSDIESTIDSKCDSDIYTSLENAGWVLESTPQSPYVIASFYKKDGKYLVLSVGQNEVELNNLFSVNITFEL